MSLENFYLCDVCDFVSLKNEGKCTRLYCCFTMLNYIAKQLSEIDLNEYIENERKRLIEENEQEERNKKLKEVIRLKEEVETLKKELSTISAERKFEYNQKQYEIEKRRERLTFLCNELGFSPYVA